MLPMKISELAQMVKGVVLSGELEARVTGLVVDSKKVKPGNIFAAFVGNTTDGHRFIPDAVDKGAKAVLVTRDIPSPGVDCAVIQVDDPLTAIQRLAVFERTRFCGPVIGVTGSNGKTTTKEMLACVFGTMGPCLFTEGNMNTELGLPLTMLRLEEAHQSIVLEMGMRGMGQIQALCDIAGPTAGIVTNIGQSHMELLGSQENIAIAKSELLQSLPATGFAALPANDPWLRRMASRTNAEILWYDILSDDEQLPDWDKSLYAYATDIVPSTTGISFTAHVNGEEHPVQLSTFGRHNVRNALGALALGSAHGLPLSAMADSLSKVSTGSGRLNVIAGSRGLTIIDDCYNASPLSMKASIEVLADFQSSKRPTVAILGEMYELGELAQTGHVEVGEYAKRKNIDILVTVGEMGRWIAEGADGGQGKVISAKTREQVVESLRDYVPDNAVVLVKASRGMGLETVVQTLTNA